MFQKISAPPLRRVRNIPKTGRVQPLCTLPLPPPIHMACYVWWCWSICAKFFTSASKAQQLLQWSSRVPPSLQPTTADKHQRHPCYSSIQADCGDWRCIPNHAVSSKEAEKQRGWDNVMNKIQTSFLSCILDELFRHRRFTLRSAQKDLWRQRNSSSSKLC